MERPQILWVARSCTVPGAGVKAHSHPYYHMFYIEAGTCQFLADGTVSTLLPGQSLLVPPHIEHSYANEASVPMEYLEIKFTLPKALGMTFSEDPLAGLLFRQILKEYSDLGSLADDAAAAYLSALLSVLSQKERYETQRRFRYVDASAYSGLTQQIIHYLETHCAEDLSLDMLADAMGYNKSYLCVAFKKDAGFTILDCLNTIRIRRAAELIVYSDHSLAQVADMCGFASVSHFNRVFLKHVGITPGQCRRAYPVDILFSPKDSASHDRPGRFMYSVLAQKTITPEMIRELDELEKKKT